MKSSTLNVATIVALTFLLLIGIFSAPVSAVVVWSDDFSDGNYDGWTILEGTFDIPVSPKYCLTASSTGLNMIYHPSVQLEGTWLFELYEDIGADKIVEILFIATGMTLMDFEGYSIYLHPESHSYRLTFCRWNYSSSFDRSARFLLNHYDIWTTGSDIPSPDWHIYNITRTIAGDVFVSRDDELVISSTPVVQEWEFSDVIVDCDKFIVKGDEDTSIDTIVVGTDLPPDVTDTTTTSSTTTNTTTTTTTTTSTIGDIEQYLPLIAIGGGAVIVIIVIVVIMKKR